MRSDTRNSIMPHPTVPPTRQVINAGDEMERIIYPATADDIYGLIHDVAREVAVERGLR